MQQRQDMILYLAHIHNTATFKGQPYGFCEVQMRLTNLRDWVYDFRNVFDVFFEVVREGYNFGDVHSISTVVPKKLPWTYAEQDNVRNRRLVYEVPRPPFSTEDSTISVVYVRQDMRFPIMQKLRETGRLDLHAPVEWLLNHHRVEFIFQRSGKLQLRDTSVWPVSAIENWPAWLREDLFGRGVDIESAYTQFLVEHITEAYEGREDTARRLFPDLFDSLYKKTEWRRSLCVDVLGLEYTEDNISTVKRLCMAMANGSRISPSILMNGISVAKDIIIEKVGATNSQLHQIGERLTQISRQYYRARNVVCLKEKGLNPTRANQKEVFRSYFQWERAARYKIWERCGRHGIMVHDGIDGIPEAYLRDIPALVRDLGIRLTAD